MNLFILRTSLLWLLAGTASQAANILVNGDFQTGSLSSFTTFTTANGNLGPISFPAVTSFDTTGTGQSLAAEFLVGENAYTGLPEGGGITQVLNLSSSGAFQFFANIAALDDANGLINADAGAFSIVIDGVTLASDSLGSFILPNQILRGTLNGSVSLSAGIHTFEILMTRDYQNASGATPSQYLDNISLSPVPESGTLALTAIALMSFPALLIQHRLRSENRK